MSSSIDISEHTRVPLGWVFAILSLAFGCLAGVAIIGIKVGSIEANSVSESRRVDRLEAEVSAISTVDRRLARIEGALGVKVPQEDRIPASK